MSVLIDFSIFPVDKGESVSPYVTKAVRIIRDSGLPFKLGPMGTSIEGDWEEVVALVTSCFEEIKKDCSRIYMSIKADYREGGAGRLEGKMKSVEGKL